jgi:hypothetical protein
LPYAPIIERELRENRVVITAARNDVFGPWREREHDDLLFATALPVATAAQHWEMFLWREANRRAAGSMWTDDVFAAYRQARASLEGRPLSPPGTPLWAAGRAVSVVVTDDGRGASVVEQVSSEQSR